MIELNELRKTKEKIKEKEKEKSSKKEKEKENNKRKEKLPDHQDYGGIGLIMEHILMVMSNEDIKTIYRIHNIGNEEIPCIEIKHKNNLYLFFFVKNNFEIKGVKNDFLEYNKGVRVRKFYIPELSLKKNGVYNISHDILKTLKGDE